MQVFADDLAWMCDQLNLVRPVVVGHSMGGIVAFDLAARYPALLSVLVVLDAAVVLPSTARVAISGLLEMSPRHALSRAGQVRPSEQPGGRSGRRVSDSHP